MKLPELPPRLIWDVEEFSLQIRALNTEWNDGSERETIVYAELTSDGKWDAQVWSLKNGGEWQDYHSNLTKEEAISVMAAAVWLGLPEYTLVEEELE